VQRAEAAAGPWTVIASEVHEHLVVGAPLFCDATAAEGHSYFYRIRARNEAGVSLPSPAVGPVAIDRRWLVDELFDLKLTAEATANVRIEKAYAHSAYLEDVAVARRADTARAATLVYRVRGGLRSFSVGIFDAMEAPRFLVRRGDGANVEVTPQVTRYGGGRRARFQAELSADVDTLEIVLSAAAPPTQAIGRVEIAFVGALAASRP
jgi:hypothetical protein